MKTVAFPTRLKLSESANVDGILIKFKPPNQGSLSELAIGPCHSMSKQKILPVEPLIQCEAGRAKTMQRQSLYSPRTPKWPPSDKGELLSADEESLAVIQIGNTTGALFLLLLLLYWHVLSSFNLTHENTCHF